MTFLWLRVLTANPGPSGSNFCLAANVPFRGFADETRDTVLDHFEVVLESEDRATDLDEPGLGVLGFFVHVDLAHVNFEAQLFDAHPDGAARRRRRHVDELQTRPAHCSDRTQNQIESN